MKKYTYIILLTVGLMIAAAGCSSVNNTVKSATSVQTGTLEHPAKLNESITLVSQGYTYKVTATNVLRGTNVAKKLSELNPGYVNRSSDIEGLIVFVEEQYVSGKTSSVYMADSLDYGAFCQNVRCHSLGSNPRLPDDITKFGDGEILTGGTKSGALVYVVPKNSEVILKFEPLQLNANNAGDPRAVFISLGNQSSSPIPASLEPTSVEPTTQDSAWIESVQKYIPLVGRDATNLAEEWGNSRRSSADLSSNANTLINDAKEALNETNQYNISSKYKDTQDEWVQSLNDFISSGNSMLDLLNLYNSGADQTSTEFQNRVSSVTNDFRNKMLSGAQHWKRAATLFNDETGSSI